MALICKISV